jgi:hypothetical protein
MAALVLACLLGTVPARAESETVLIHVKTALSVDDAQICAVPNVAWATLSQGKRVTLLFDASAVTSIAKGYGWWGWLGSDATAMDRAALPERERQSLASQFSVPLDQVPRDYGAYLGFLREKGVELYYNRTMALLYQIDPERIDARVRPLDLKGMAEQLTGADRVLVY